MDEKLPASTAKATDAAQAPGQSSGRGAPTGPEGQGVADAGPNAALPQSRSSNTADEKQTALEEVEQPLKVNHSVSEGEVEVEKPLKEKPTFSEDELEVEKLAKEKPSTSNEELEARDKDITDQSSESMNEENERREKEVQKLVRKLTPESYYDGEGQHINPFETNPGSRYDPNSPSFSARAWTRRAMEFQRSDPTSGPPRTAGFAFRNLNIFGYGTPTDYQKSVSNVWLEATTLVQRITGTGKRRIDILRTFEGVVYPGEMLVVLGPPGSGCTTFLKTISGEMNGLNIQESSYINYQGIDPKTMHKSFRGEAIYTAEVDVHFPEMTVADTLTFAARARAPRHIPGGLKMEQWADHIRDVVMAMYGISHTKNTRVGNDYIRGVSGGERKRVTIAEAMLSGAPLQCWDNSTRGLDSANAIEFCKTLRLNADMSDTCAAVSIYQAPQSAYDLFDKVLVLYEGRQIFFGKCNEARGYFEELGFDCPDRQTTADFLTSMTSPQERVVRPGWEGRVPQTPDDFALRWQESSVRKALGEEIDAYDEKYKVGGEYLEKFKESRRAQQSKHQTVKSPFTLSFAGQIRLCVWRGFQRLKGDPSITFVQIIANSINALVISSVFFNLQPNTNSFFSRGSLLFFAVLMNAFGSALEILTLYAQRPIVEKQSRYAFYHPSAEAVASMLVAMPSKIGNAIGFNLVLYFMTNLRRQPGPFFFFLLVSFLLTLVMSMFFRFLASISRTLPGAMTPAAVFILAIIIFTGFVVPTKYMLGWCRWINYVDPVAYGFEALMINEFHDRNFPCSRFVPSGPGYEGIGGSNQICGSVGSVLGQSFVNGDAYINSAYAYYHKNKWRNVGIMFGFVAGFMIMYLIAAELVSSKKSKGEVLVFRRGKVPSSVKSHSQKGDIEANDKQSGGPLSKIHTQEDVSAMIQRQTSIFSWRDVCFDIKMKGETKRILDHVDGWVKPGTLTALMGVSGAGKTTLLDALATRTTIGVLTGEMLVDGRQRDQSFQRKTGYVQQQDLHLSTQTVREALNFSALLRQPRHIPRKDKLAYVDEVIKLLDMEEYAEAVVGVPGEGLNVEQRKRLTIGVELAAKPQLLLFLDEPTSGLDSQTSWAICDLMEKLTNSGQAILCTIHQPSAMLFQRFSRLLFLQKGGQTVYFGEIGANAQTMIEYFERHSKISCPKDANPAEWMLEVIGAAPGSHTDVNWFETWRDSPEYQGVHRELDRLKSGEISEKSHELVRSDTEQRKEDAAAYATYAAPFSEQWWEVQKRVFEQYWRTPGYIYSKLLLCCSTSLFVGFVFYKAPLTQQGLQNQLFAIFMLLTIFGQLAQQMMPLFVTQRALYEVRERPSKAYNWQVFIIANVLIEIAWQSLMAVGMFLCFYYPVGMYRNAIPAGQVHERGALFFLYVWIFLVFTSTFTHMVIAAVETAEAGGNIVNVLFSMCLIFCGVLAGPSTLPRFWIFMYRVSPFTYMVAGFMSTGLANTAVTCADNEYLRFDPPQDQTCGTFMARYISTAGGYLVDPTATRECSYCSIASTNVFLAGVNTSYGQRWRNFGILWAFVFFNVFAALTLYWFFRVPKGSRSEDKSVQTGAKKGLLAKPRAVLLKLLKKKK